MIINGRYLSAPLTGVQRVASALLRAVDAALPDAEAESWRLVRPSRAPAERLLRLPQSTLVGAGGQVWEQTSLPWAARSQLLLNLCNTGPIAHPRSVVMIHDAQVFTSPSSYSPLFVAWYRMLLPIIARRALRVLTVSEFSSAQLVEAGVTTADRITVIPNGGDHLSQTEADNSVHAELRLGDAPYVLALSSLQDHKNLATLLRAKRDPRTREVPLVLAGRADAAAFAEAGFDTPPGVIFTGPVSDGQLLGLMRKALAFALPSRTEGFGLPALEAFACGCPVIAASAGALPEVCGSAALFVDPNDAEGWADAIVRLVDNRTLATSLSEAGRQRGEGYTWARSGSALLAALRELN